ncbi:hypothetical protein SVA_2847 [Sulfurifustis variabilis]|uniref:PepSY domain-containing protein n=1 Tax=Sulfurifustis variabilis TaxID=1675686 RepID=A0A1B4V7E3_9GAMM|nr:PepSY domain-containing protein [Sulfurifustis variabilis]BAU49395.1 hypothetical protein SVA_2847 [Sulfurifustis variabilis]
MKKYLIAGFVIAGLSGGIGAAVASSGDESVQPAQPRLVIEQAVALAKHQVPGTVIEAELEHEGARDLYEVKVEDKAGRMHKIRIDAATAERL